MAQGVSLNVASRLVGLDPSVVSKRASAGRYGPTKSVPRAGRPEVHVSTRGLELASGRLIPDAQIQAARAGRPLPPAQFEIKPARPHKIPSIDEIGAQVVREWHAPLDLGDCDL
jgi:hypothetical protein